MIVYESHHRSEKWCWCSLPGSTVHLIAYAPKSGERLQNFTEYDRRASCFV